MASRITSRVRSSYSDLITYCHSTLRIDKIAWKNSKYSRKKLQFITLLMAILCIVSHIENRKNNKGYITKQYVDILTRCSK